MNSLTLLPSFSRCAAGLTVLVLASMPCALDAASRVRQVSARTLVQGYAADPLAGDPLRPQERAFLSKVSETTRQQMRLAEVGVSQARGSEVRSHARALARDYRSMNDSLEALIRLKGGLAGAPVGGTSETYQKLVAKAGPNFDREFVRAVGSATDDLLSLFEQIISETRDDDVREFAAAQLPILRAHRTTSVDLRKTLG